MRGPEFPITVSVLLGAALLTAACSHDVGPSGAASGLPTVEAGLPDAFDAGWKGEAVCEKLFENEDVRTARCTFAPGKGHERHTHKPHWGYILQGSTMRTTDANGTVERALQTGSTWWSDGIAWHEALNIGDQTSIYLIIEPKSAQARKALQAKADMQ
jgi:quercetin dioxygenase-like cupin family protein